MLEAEGIHFGYTDKEIIKGISLKVEESSLSFIVGPNGAGKSTLLSCLSGHLAPSCGRITVGGVEIGKLDPRERTRLVAWLPQGVEPAFGFSVFETVAMGIEARKEGLGMLFEEEKERVTGIIRDFGLEHLAGRPINSLSFGERQKCLIAATIIPGTPVILLDEPTASLDPHQAVYIMEYIHGLSRKGKIVLVVSHDLNLASIFGDHVFLMHEGRLLASGPPREVITEPLLHKAYGEGIRVSAHPGGTPAILPERLGGKEWPVG